MVSDKVIIVLITIAILLSAVSIAVTISAVNTTDIPQPQQPHIEYKSPVPDADRAQVAINIQQPGVPTA